MMKRSEMEARWGVQVPTLSEADAEMAEAMETMQEDGPFASAKNDPWSNPSPVDMVPAPW